MNWVQVPVIVLAIAIILLTTSLADALARRGKYREATAWLFAAVVQVSALIWVATTVSWMKS